MPKDLFSYDKFWVIWVSCLDKPRTIKEIQNVWEYGGNSLYQKGQESNIWKEMVRDGYLVRQGRVQKRGVSGVLLYSKVEWVPAYLKSKLSEEKFKQSNPLPYDIFECFSPGELARFLDKERGSLFLISALKTMFGTKDNVRDYKEMCLLAPMKAIVDIYIMSFIKEHLGLKRDTFFLATTPIVFNLSGINYQDYFHHVFKTMKASTMPKDLFSKERLMALWRAHTDKLFKIY